ncbi:Facilitated trehalose transporter Tret1 [Chamberlinius hualienensis]
MAISNRIEIGAVRILFCSFISGLSIVSCGIAVSYQSPAVPDINSHRNPYYVNSDEESWIGGLLNLGAIVGGAFCGTLMDNFGRKLALMISALPNSVGWLLVIASQNIGTMYAGRFICGISLGMAKGAAHVYIAETAPAKFRGSFCTLTGICFSLGVIYTYVFGYFLNWQWLAVAGIAVVFINMIGLYFLPETPRWLLIQAQTDKEKATEAAEILSWLRGPKADIENELKEIQTSVIETSKEGPWKDLLMTCNLKNMALCLSLLAVHQLSGNANINMYSVSIFQSAGTEMNPNLEAIIVGVVGMLGSLVCVLTVDHIGRRIVLTSSSAGTAASMLILGAYYKVKEYDPDYAVLHLSWIPMLSLTMNDFFVASGISSIAWMLPSELFPTNLRGKSYAVCVIWFYVCGFIATKFFVNITNSIGVAGGYWIFAGFGIAGCFIGIFATPETKKKTLEQLQTEI